MRWAAGRLGPGGRRDKGAAARRGLRQAPDPGHSPLLRGEPAPPGARFGRSIQLHNRIHPTGVAGAGESLPLNLALGAVAEEGLRRLVRDGLAAHIGFTGLGDAAATAAVARDGRFATVQTPATRARTGCRRGGCRRGWAGFRRVIGHGGGERPRRDRDPPDGRRGARARRRRRGNTGDPGGPLAGGPGYAQDRARAQALLPLVGELGLETHWNSPCASREQNPGFDGRRRVLRPGAARDALRWTARGPLPSPVVDRIVALARSVG